MGLPDKEELIKQIMLTAGLIWDNPIDRDKIDKWLSNFTGELFETKKEHQIALWLLVNFVYYNEKEVKHLCKILYSDFIHSEAEKQIGSGLSVEEITRTIITETRFVNLGTSGESGGYICYYFRKESNISINDFVTDLTSLEKQVNHLVFVDDVSLSGGQAKRSIKKALEGVEFDGRVSVLTMVSSSKAIEKLANENIDVISSILLTEKNQAFNQDSNIFLSYPELLGDAKAFAEHYGRKTNNLNPLGWKNGQYLFGFSYNTPNNTLPIFWADENGWKPIVNRTSKNYDETEYKREFI